MSVDSVDMFCGAGGAGCGIEAAGFDLVTAIDQCEESIQTHQGNLDAETIQHDLSEVDPSVLSERARSAPYFHGSAPCQGFSYSQGARDRDDERNSLVFSFIEWLDELQPRVATMENVAGMKDLTPHFMERVVARFRDAGYDARYRVLNAADFGVPQTRRRLICVAIRDDIEKPREWFPKPTHSASATRALNGRELSEWVSVEESIGDLAGRVEKHRPQGENNATSGASWRPGNVPAHTVKGQGSHVAQTEGRGDGTASLPNHDPPESEPGEARQLTVRECARLQSFPDWFEFTGSKTSQYLQVGNAVPPLLQERLARHVREVVF